MGHPRPFHFTHIEFVASYAPLFADEDSAQDVSGPVTGAVGLSAWNTSAAYDDVKVTAADGSALLGDDFSGDASTWSHTGTGSWSVQAGSTCRPTPPPRTPWSPPATRPGTTTTSM